MKVLNISYYVFRPQVIAFLFVDAGSLDEIKDYINSSPNVSTPASRSGNTLTWRMSNAPADSSVSVGGCLQVFFNPGQEMPFNFNVQTPDEAYQNGLDDLQAIGSPVVTYELDES